MCNLINGAGKLEMEEKIVEIGSADGDFHTASLLKLR